MTTRTGRVFQNPRLAAVGGNPVPVAVGGNPVPVAVGGNPVPVAVGGNPVPVAGPNNNQLLHWSNWLQFRIKDLLRDLRPRDWVMVIFMTVFLSSVLYSFMVWLLLLVTPVLEHDKDYMLMQRTLYGWLCCIHSAICLSVALVCALLHSKLRTRRVVVVMTLVTVMCCYIVHDFTDFEDSVTDTFNRKYPPSKRTQSKTLVARKAQMTAMAYKKAIRSHKRQLRKYARLLRQVKKMCETSDDTEQCNKVVKKYQAKFTIKKQALMHLQADGNKAIKIAKTHKGALLSPDVDSNELAAYAKKQADDKAKRVERATADIVQTIGPPAMLTWLSEAASKTASNFNCMRR
jgi:hypothetical protein